MLYKVYGDSALLALNGTSLNSVNALLALNRRFKVAAPSFKPQIRLSAKYSWLLIDPSEHHYTPHWHQFFFNRTSITIGQSLSPTLECNQNGISNAIQPNPSTDMAHIAMLIRCMYCQLRKKFCNVFASYLVSFFLPGNRCYTMSQMHTPVNVIKGCALMVRYMRGNARVHVFIII